MLVEKFDLEVFTPPCNPGADRFAAKAHLRVDISAALPYLNATLKGAVYYPSAQSLTWKKAGHNCLPRLRGRYQQCRRPQRGRARNRRVGRAGQPHLGTAR